jgi:hypothetical protein
MKRTMFWLCLLAFAVAMGVSTALIVRSYTRPVVYSITDHGYVDLNKSYEVTSASTTDAMLGSRISTGDATLAAYWGDPYMGDIDMSLARVYRIGVDEV